jgi:hypothetical protein
LPLIVTVVDPPVIVIPGSDGEPDKDPLTELIVSNISGTMVIV